MIFKEAYGMEENLCPVCGRHVFAADEEYEICPVCGWENDCLQNSDHSYAGGANDLSANEARIEFIALSMPQTAPVAKQLKDEYEQAKAHIRAEYSTPAEQANQLIAQARRSYIGRLAVMVYEELGI